LLYSLTKLSINFSISQRINRVSIITKRVVLLIDLPTFPKGVISLSLLSVASCLSHRYDVRLTDLNLIDFNGYILPPVQASVYGLKVSSQNINQAIILSQKIKTFFPDSIILWGGELPSLLPDLCLEHADTIIGGLFEPIASRFMDDLDAGTLQKKYFGDNTSTIVSRPDFVAFHGLATGDIERMHGEMYFLHGAYNAEEGV
jgi:hypothetical protein